MHRSNEQVFKTHRGKKSVTTNTRKVYEWKSKKCALEEQIDGLKKQLLSLQKRNETLEYARRHCMQKIDELEEDVKNC